MLSQKNIERLIETFSKLDPIARTALAVKLFGRDGIDALRDMGF